MSRKGVYFLLSVLLVFVLIGAIWGYNLFSMINKMKAMGPPVEVITASKVQARTWQPFIRAVGNFVAVNGVDLSSEAAGIVQSIEFNPGETVKKGKILFQLDDAVDQASLEDHEAQLNLAEINNNRQSELYRKNAISKSTLDESQAKLKQASAAVARTQALIAQKKITAPFNGKVGIRMVNLGEYIHPGTTKLVTIQELNPLYIQFSLPEQRLQQLTMNQEVELIVDAFPGKVFKGKINAIDAKVNPNTHNVLVQATVPNDEQALYPGMFADVKVLLPISENVLTLPKTAIMYSLYGDEVFMIEEETNPDTNKKAQKVKRKFVTTGEEQGSEVVITSGVQVDELIVDSGQLKLQNGTFVKIDNTAQLQQSTKTAPTED